MVCRWWIHGLKACRHPCALWATSATRSQLRILPRIVEEHPSCCTQNVEQAKIEFAVETGSRYLGSFIGETAERDSWIANKEGDWVCSIKKLAHTVLFYAHSAYSALPALRTTRMADITRPTLNHALIYQRRHCRKSIYQHFLAKR